MMMHLLFPVLFVRLIEIHIFISFIRLYFNTHALAQVQFLLLSLTSLHFDAYQSILSIVAQIFVFQIGTT